MSPDPSKDSQLARVLSETTRYHARLCPRQVLGARLGLLGLRVLGFDAPPPDKVLHAFVETDGCFVDGLSAATGCRVGARTLHVIDYGKMAATLVDAQSGLAYRIRPRASAREAASLHAPNARDRWDAYLEGYRKMPDDDLFEVQQVRLRVPIEEIISTEDAKTICSGCGEEIFNGREVVEGQQVLCQSCAGNSYYLTGSG